MPGFVQTQRYQTTRLSFAPWDVSREIIGLPTRFGRTPSEYVPVLLVESTTPSAVPEWTSEIAPLSNQPPVRSREKSWDESIFPTYGKLVERIPNDAIADIVP